MSLRNRIVDAAPSSRSARVGLTLVVVTSLGVSLILFLTLVMLLRTNGQEIPGGFSPGADFATFSAYADLVYQGKSVAVYDPASLAEILERLDSPSESDSAPLVVAYGYPPPFFQLLALLSPLRDSTAMVAWTVAGLLALSLSLWLLLGRGSRLLLYLSVASVPAWITLRLGQAAFFWLLILAIAFVLGQRQKYWLAGGVIGLLILKPTLLAAIVLLLLVYARSFAKVLMGATTTIAVMFTVSFALDRSLWNSYVAAPLERVDDISAFAFSRYTFSVPDSLVLLGIPTTLAWAAGATVALATAVFVWRKVDPSWFNIIVVAVPLTLLAVPRTFVYEWMLLAVPLVALWVHRPHHRDRLWVAVGLLSLTTLMSPVIATQMVSTWGWGFHLATFAIAFFLVDTLLELSRQRQPPSIDVGIRFGVAPVDSEDALADSTGQQA